MSERLKKAVIPAILAGSALYYALMGKGEDIGDLAKTAMGRVVDDEVKARRKPTPAKNPNKRPRGRKFKVNNDPKPKLDRHCS
jgi:hypothetical protein